MPQLRHVIRQENLRRLMGAKSQREFAAFLSQRLPADRPMSPAYLGQLLQDLTRLESGNKQGVRAIGDEKARDIERAMDKPEGWMDVRHDEGELEPEKPLDLRVRDQAGDINALAYAVGALISVVAKKRPDEGEAIAELLKSQVDPKYLSEGGLLEAVLEAIDSAKQSTAAAAPVVRAPARRRGE